MRKYKIVKDGYVLNVGDGLSGEEITDEEYEEILSVIQSVPTPPTGFCYRLKTDLTWEAYAIDPSDPDPDIDGAEAFDFLFGGGLE